MLKDNVAIVVVLRLKATGGLLMVANPHMAWEPQYADVKAIQTAMLMEELEQIGRGSAIPTLICGDFNSLPDSGVYSFLSTGSLPKDSPDFGGREYGPYTKHGAYHRFGLSSAYSAIGELPFTNYTGNFQGTIDYIWSTTSSLALLKLLGPVPEAYAKKTYGFPNPHFPSDHISLAAEFKLLSPTQRRNNHSRS